MQARPITTSSHALHQYRCRACAESVTLISSPDQWRGATLLHGDVTGSDCRGQLAYVGLDPDAVQHLRQISTSLVPIAEALKLSRPPETTIPGPVWEQWLADVHAISALLFPGDADAFVRVCTS